MAENEVVLIQNDNLGFNVQIKLVDGRELQVLKTGKKNEQRYSIDILALQDKSKKVFIIAWKWLVASISIFLVMLLLLKFLPPLLNENRNLYLGIILFTGLVGSIFSLVRFWKYTARKQVFHSLNAHIPVIAFNIGRPSKQVFSEFIANLEKRITKFRKHMDLAMDKQLTGEMKMLRRLADAGIISKTDYEKAKTKLFSGFDSHFTNRSDQD
jgi:hypothetical protein